MWISILALVLILGVGVLGWELNSWLRGTHSVHVTSTFTGTVRNVDAGGQYGCITPDRGGKPACTVFAVLTSQAGRGVHVGDPVRVALETIDNADGGYPVLFIYPLKNPTP